MEVGHNGPIFGPFNFDELLQIRSNHIHVCHFLFRPHVNQPCFVIDYPFARFVEVFDGVLNPVAIPGVDGLIGRVNG